MGIVGLVMYFYLKSPSPFPPSLPSPVVEDSYLYLFYCSSDLNGRRPPTFLTVNCDKRCRFDLSNHFYYLEVHDTWRSIYYVLISSHNNKVVPSKTYYIFYISPSFCYRRWKGLNMRWMRIFPNVYDEIRESLRSFKGVIHKEWKWWRWNFYYYPKEDTHTDQ